MAIFTNQALLSYRNGTVSSNVVTGEIVGVLTANKNALLTTYSAGDTVSYVISIYNSGTTALTGVSVSDDLGAYPFGATTLVPLTYIDGSIAYYLDGVLQPAPTVTATGTTLDIEGITVPQGGYALLIYEVRLNDYAPLATGGEITNTATITSGNETVTASETINASTEPILSITKGVNPQTVSENGQLTYTFTIQNFGNTEATAADTLSVSDTFDPILNPITVTYNGTVWTAGNEYTYNSSTGLFTTTPGNITVPAATYSQDPTTGEWNVTPGTATLVVTGTV